MLSLVDQPDSAELCHEVYDGRMGLVPYVHAGLRPCQGRRRRRSTRIPRSKALILDKHGIFTFGESAREAYERMIEMVTRAEERLKKNRKAVFVTAQHAAAGRAERRGRADRARRRAASRTPAAKAPTAA